MPTAERSELAAEVRQLGGRLTAAVAELHGLVVNNCLTTETHTFGPSGVCHRDWTVPYGSVAVHNGGTAQVTVTNQGAAESAPLTGAGVVPVPPGAGVVANFTGRVLTVYGKPGERVVFSVFTQPQAPAWAQVGAL